MYSDVSEQFKKGVKDRVIISTAKLTFKDFFPDDLEQPDLVLNNSNISDNGIKISDYCYNNGQLVGTAMTKEAEIELKNTENYDLADKTFDLEIGIDTSEEVLSGPAGMTVYVDVPEGHSEQDETPTPSNPSEIHSTGDNGTITITQETKNKISLDGLIVSPESNLEYSIANNHLILKAIGTRGAQICRKIIENLDDSKNYTFSCKAKKNIKGTDGQSSICVRFYGSNDGENFTNLGTTGTYISPTDIIEGQEFSLLRTLTGYKYYRFYFYNNTSTPVTIGEETEYWDIQLEERNNTNRI